MPWGAILTLDEMRDEFAENVSDLEAGLDDAKIETYLNRAYQFTIPEEVGGEWSEQIWNLTLSVGVSEFDYATSIVGTYGLRAWIESISVGAGELASERTYVNIMTDPLRFEQYEYDDGSTGRPNNVLLYGRKVRLDRTTDFPYILKIPARGGPIFGIQVEGISHATHAKAVIHTAAADFLMQVEDDMGAQRNLAQAEIYLTRMRRIANSSSHERDWVRSF